MCGWGQDFSEDFSSCGCKFATILLICKCKYGPEKLIRYSNSLRARRPGVRIPVVWDFPKLSDWSLGLHSLLYNGYRVFSRGKATGAWRWPRTPSSAEVKERVDLYLLSPYGPLWPVLRWTLPLSLPLCVNMLKIIHGSILFFLQFHQAVWEIICLCTLKFVHSLSHMLCILRRQYFKYL
jgi:hypothetical protein